MTRRCPLALTGLSLVLAVLILALPLAAQQYKIADQVGNLRFVAPLFPEDAQYLGLAKPGPFTLKDLKAPYVLLDVFATTCPHCLMQAPTLNALFQMASQNPKTKDTLKFVGSGAGDNELKIKAWKQMQQVQFPLLPDPDNKIFNALKLPGTPVTVILNKDGKVLWSHIGALENAEATLKEIIKALKL